MILRPYVEPPLLTGGGFLYLRVFLELARDEEERRFLTYTLRRKCHDLLDAFGQHDGWLASGGAPAYVHHLLAALCHASTRPDYQAALLGALALGGMPAVAAIAVADFPHALR